MARIAGAALAAALALPAAACAHDPGTATPTGFVATVSKVLPRIAGLQARIVVGDQLLVANRTDARVVILDPAGKPFVRIPTGASRAWHDGRIRGSGGPPEPAAGASETAPRFVRNWRVPGRVGRRAFAVEGFLEWVPPPDVDEGSGVSGFLLAGAAAALVALSAGAAYLLGRVRP